MRVLLCREHQLKRQGEALQRLLDFQTSGLLANGQEL